MNSAQDILASLGGKDELLPENTAVDTSLDSSKSDMPTITASKLAQDLHLSSLEERALSLLGSGCNSDSVAAALGVHTSRISQLLSEASFAGAVAELRYNNLQKHNHRDNAYDTLEDKLLHKLDKALPLLVRPESILKAINVVNQAKRRGSSAPEQVTNQQNIVTLIMPTVIANKFTTNINNQVVRAGDQDLMTMESRTLLKKTESAKLLTEEEVSCTTPKQDSPI